MSDVLIKNMKIPETCYECPCGNNDFYECLATEEKFRYHRDEYGYPDGERQDWCPLVPVPPHGRLIDADALLQEHERIVDSWGKVHIVSAQAIRNAPTIIEAEESET